MRGQEKPLFKSQVGPLCVRHSSELARRMPLHTDAEDAAHLLQRHVRYGHCSFFFFV
jgi:hypothetical protein